jgi:methyl-accepting chemotaxis protein
MRISIQTKWLVMSILLVLLTAISISTTYYVMTKRAKYRESQQRVQIAFDIVLDDLADRAKTDIAKCDELLKKESTLHFIPYMYNHDESQIRSSYFIVSFLIILTGRLKEVGETVAADRIAIYGANKRLLALYHRDGDRALVGSYVVSQAGNDAYFPMDDPAQVSDFLSVKKQPIPDVPLPAGFMAHYPDEMPERISSNLFRDGQQLGLRIVAPLYQGENKTGIFVWETIYTQNMAERYAALNQTAVNFFAGNQLSFGTLPAQGQLEPETLAQIVACEDLVTRKQTIDVFSVSFNKQAYYQGRCAFKNAQGPVGAITVSLSQEIAKQEVKKILIAVFVISGIVILIAFGLAAITSWRTTRAINQLMTCINRIAKGDLPEQMTIRSGGELNDIKRNVNMLIETMRGLLDETNMLIQAVQDGNLEMRGHADRFEGNWRELIRGVNRLIEAFVKPITVTATYIDQLAKGEIPPQITEEYKGDFNQIKHNLSLLIAANLEVNQLAEQIAAGNLLVAVRERSGQDTLMQALNDMIQKLKDVVINVMETADIVAHSSQMLSSQSAAMSQGATEQASAAEEVSASMEQMTATIGQNADNAQQTEQIALQSTVHAEESRKVLAETIAVMQQIAQKTTIVEKIANQTRLLSLNATIEAAKAQEHGQMFAVIASEVRNLSNITRKAAEEITKLAKSSFEVSAKAEDRLSTLVPSIHKTAELVQQISVASSEQSTGTKHINQAIQQLDQVTQQNAAISEEIASAAQELADQAAQLQRTMEFFNMGELSV